MEMTENKHLEKPWYALFVKSGSEERIRRDLMNKFGDELGFHVPKKLMKERKKGILHSTIRPLFPGYILVNGEITGEVYYRLKEVLDIYFIIKDGFEPVLISEEEISPILHFMNLGVDGVIGVSDIIMEGDLIFVKAGPLKAFEGMIKSVNHRKGRAKVQFFVAGQEKMVELAVNVLSKS
jgi:transcriptional antiterminator NusG